MPRPPKHRRVGFIPEIVFFKPAGVPAAHLEEVSLTVDELEAIRLKDYLGWDQNRCAEAMAVSRPTLQRILVSGRRKIADALVNGKAVRVEGGNYKLAKRRFRCRKCAEEFDVPFGTGQRGIDMTCPSCGERQVHRVDAGGHGFGRQPWGRRIVRSEEEDNEQEE